MSLLGIFLIILAGLLLFLLEILVIPGITIAGIGALILMGLAVYLAFSAFGVLTGLIVLLVVLFPDHHPHHNCLSSENLETCFPEH